jgi:hypothetical protein
LSVKFNVSVQMQHVGASPTAAAGFMLVVAWFDKPKRTKNFRFDISGVLVGHAKADFGCDMLVHYFINT